MFKTSHLVEWGIFYFNLGWTLILLSAVLQLQYEFSSIISFTEHYQQLYPNCSRSPDNFSVVLQSYRRCKYFQGLKILMFLYLKTVSYPHAVIFNTEKTRGTLKELPIIQKKLHCKCFACKEHRFYLRAKFTLNCLWFLQIYFCSSLKCF